MTINNALKKLEAKAKLLFPDCERHAVNMTTEFWTSLHKPKIRVHLMGFYNWESDKKVESLVAEGVTIKSVFDQVNREIDGMSRRVNIEVE